MRLFISAVFALILSSCAINDPVSVAQVVDNSPVVSFDVSGYDPYNLTFTIDGLSYGSVSKYLSTGNSLKLITGKHEIEIMEGSTVIYSKSQFFGDSTTTIIKVMP